MTTATQNILDQLFPVKNAADVPLTEQTGTLYGGYGSGKSTLMAGFPDALIIDTENGYRNLTARAVHASDYDETIAKIQSAIQVAAQGHAKVIVVDSMTKVHEWAAKKLKAENGWEYLTDPGYGKGFEMLAERIKTDVVDPLLALNETHGIGAWFVCHMQEKEDFKTKKTRVTPLLDKRVVASISGTTHMVLEMDASVLDEQGNPMFCLRSQLSDSVDAKDRSRRLPAVLLMPNIHRVSDPIAASGALYATLESAYNQGGSGATA